MSIITTEEGFIPLGSGEIYWKSWEPEGAAARGQLPVVLVHDSLGSVGLWRRFPELLAQASGRKIFAYDRLGYGQSSPLGPALPAPDFVTTEGAEVLPAVIEALDLKEIALLGHSVGGGMSVIAGATRPDLVKAIVTVSAHSFLETSTAEAIARAKTRFHETDDFAKLARYHGDKTQWTLDAWTETWLSPDFAHWRLDAYLDRLTQPLHALHGTDDEHGTLAHPRRISQGADRSMHIFDGVGHFPHREIPEQLAEETSRFLARIDPARG